MWNDATVYVSKLWQFIYAKIKCKKAPESTHLFSMQFCNILKTEVVLKQNEKNCKLIINKQIRICIVILHFICKFSVYFNWNFQFFFSAKWKRLRLFFVCLCFGFNPFCFLFIFFLFCLYYVVIVKLLRNKFITF